MTGKKNALNNEHCSRASLMPGTDYSFELCVEPRARSFARLLCIVDLYSNVPPTWRVFFTLDGCYEGAFLLHTKNQLSSMAIQAFFKSSQADPVCSFILLDLATQCSSSLSQICFVFHPVSQNKSFFECSLSCRLTALAFKYHTGMKSAA